MLPLSRTPISSLPPSVLANADRVLAIFLESEMQYLKSSLWFSPPEMSFLRCLSISVFLSVNSQRGDKNLNTGMNLFFAGPISGFRAKAEDSAVCSKITSHFIESGHRLQKHFFLFCAVLLGAKRQLIDI